ncbi:HNH endonuclease [Flavobacterium terrigena]|uniref:Putative restriction endonuclease n=1 Tax=Flavobacterium terrigena TaxID=402734 RepID=A0A1H6ULL9_9FLAO|nr:HNH endonuclease [Flavobacterium terrigena]SEI91614.1 putative restriction endonuclease [Flavobacterium terrigena]
MKIEKLDNYIIAKVLFAYLVESKSHRDIQKKILSLPAPQNGGGYETMKILHHFDLKKESKGILKDSLEEIGNLDSDAQEIIISYIATLDEARALIERKPINPNNKETERLSTVKTRVYQDVLKEYVSENYNNCCAFCDNDQSELLVASHIVPWKSDKSKRLDLDNCILLCNFHDKLFDKGFITLNEDYSMLISQELSQSVVNQIKSKKFKIPKSDNPNHDNLKLHREYIFRL